MLQRAASNAYSWWWASHIRTNQSKWLDSNLHEMEDRVQSMLKIIEEDADSFAKRAEMYYKRRPELINFVEETYRAYRALAERYDRISGELHKANHTLATAFPDVEFPMQDEDDDDSTKIHKSSPDAPQISFQKPPPEVPQISLNKPPPQIPQFRLINKRSEKKPTPKKPPPRQFTSQISEDKAKEEIDRLQKGILVLQTEKEFIKSSYESGIAKYWDIEKKITEMQEQVCFLQDEFSSSAVIEDDEARALMAVAALKSCKDTLVNLQEQQKRSIEETRIESERIKVAKEKLKALKRECGQLEKELGEISDENTGTSPPIMTMEEEACDLQQESLQLQSICENVKENFEISSDASTVELAEKIDELVNKVINLELTVSSQTAQIQRLRSETDDLQKHLQSMEEEKLCLIYENSFSGKLKQAEEDLHQIQNLEKRVKYEKNMLNTNFREACHSLSDISENLQSPKHQDQVKIAEKLQSPKHQDQVKIADPSPSQEDRSRLNIEQRKETEEEEAPKFQDTKDNVEDNTLCPKDQENQVQLETVPQLGNLSRKFQTPEQGDEIVKESLQANDSNHPSSDSGVQSEEQDDAANLQQLLLNGLEDREKILLAEYTSILRNYKETKRKLFELEKKNKENFSETMSQVRELKNANANKDQEILSLRQILSALQTTTSSKLQNSELSEDLILEATAKNDTSSTVQDREILNAEEDLKPYHVNAPQIASPIEEKFRRDIDTLLDENLEFWLRFSSSFHQIQRFQTEFQSLQTDIDNLKDRKVHEGSSSASEHAAKPESAPIDKQLRELKTELQVWVEQNALLRGELQSRFSSLCDIQEEISGVLKANSEVDGIQFTPYQAAKFQGEVLNMKQEHNKVADELQAGLDHVRGLQVEVEKTMSALSKLHEKIVLSSSKSGHHHNHHFRHFSSKNRGVPLRSFLYGVKSKKPSIFACMNPALQKQYSDLRAGMPI